MRPKEYICECCNQEFTKGWSDKEAEDEWAINFPTLGKEDRAMVCNNCFHKIMKFNKHPGF